MEIGIIGLPASGRTTLFEALTCAKPEARGGVAVNVGVAKVPDKRLEGLNKMFQPKRVVLAEIKYIDIVGGFGKGGVGGQLLTQLGTVDAFIHVIRLFENASIPHVEGSLDALRDVEAFDLELAFSDLAIIERRLKRIEESLKGARSQEREPLLKEEALLQRVKKELEREGKLIENYQFLTAKPVLLVLNIGEEQIGQANSIEAKLLTSYKRPNFRVAALCAKLEKELCQVSESEAADFRASWGLGEPGINRLIRLSYELLGLLSFFTIVSGEVKAWTVRQGTTALKAAGKIHTDMERGFIRAEVIAYNDLVECGSLAEARRRGLLRLEGKGYVVQDGDIITFLFNV
jgi:GTP-binding protein YchF